MKQIILILSLLFLTVSIQAQEFFSKPEGRPYKVYTALLTQEGTDAPEAIVLENNTGLTFNWVYGGVGIYYTITDGLIMGKVVVIFTSNLNTARMTAVVPTNTYVEISSKNNSLVYQNGLMTQTPIEIRVYP